MKTPSNRWMVALPFLLAAGLALGGCKGGGHDVVESGTYQGTIKKVNPDEREIYVDSSGRELELYFTDQTQLTRADQPAEFDALQEGQRVEVQVEKVGQRLDPLTVKILQ